MSRFNAGMDPVTAWQTYGVGEYGDWRHFLNILVSVAFADLPLRK
jgi:hypothetical protein